MKQLWFAPVLLVIAIWCPAWAQTEAGDWRSWGTQADTLVGAVTGQRLYLKAPFILEGSEKVHLRGAILDASDYEINYQQGLVRIKAPVDGARVIVEYVRLPFLLNSVYSLRDIEIADSPEPLPPQRTGAREQQLFNPTGDLVFGGVKSISFSVGSSRSAELDQTLRARVEGHLTSSIQVKALLSDDNLPIQPEGSTEELEYLDKVLVEITGPRAKATLGDFAYQDNTSAYSTFSRQLKGASGVVGTDGSNLGAAAGQAKGVFRTLTFRATEQLQGPYELLARGRTSGEVVIAGTERVYMDGQLLQRGKNRDYTIDYDMGTITFTPRRVMTADTEIAVDFEVTQTRFDRTSVFGSGSTQQLPAGFQLKALVAREADDAGSPVSAVLSEEDRLILAEVGDDEASAIGNGVTFVGVGEGDYTKVPADTIAGTPEFFVYDDSTGAFDVVFTDVGAGKGDYILDGRTNTGLPVYRFVGAALGNAVVGRRLPLPQTHRMMTARLKREGRLSVDVQYNVSDFDANTLSDRDDDDNLGDAGQLRLGLSRMPLGGGHFNLSGTISTVEDRFKSLERARSPYFYKDWNLEGEPIVGREVLQELATSFVHGGHVTLAYDAGQIRRDNFRGTKHEGRMELARIPDQKLTTRAFSTQVTGNAQKRTRQHGTASVALGFWRLLPTVTYGTEEFRVASPVLPDSGIAFDRYLFRLAKRKETRFTYALQYEERHTDALTDTSGGWFDSRRDRTYGVSVASRGFSSLQGEMEYTHRIQDDHVFDSRSTADLARLAGLWRVDRAGLRTNVDYEISQNQLRTQERSVVFVGEGQGDYSELGEPVGKGRGDYTIVFVPTDEMIPTRNVGLDLRIGWDPRGEASGRGLLAWVARNLSLRSSFSVREETTFEQAHQVYLLFPSALQRNGSTLHGRISLIQEWSLLRSYPNTSLTLYYQRDDEEENRFNAVNEDRFFEQQTIKGSRSLSSRLTVNAEVRRELRRRGGEGFTPGTGSTYDVEGIAIGAGWGLRFAEGSTFDGELEGSRQKDDESAALQLALALRLRALWRLTNNLNLFGRYEVTQYGLENESVKPLFYSEPGTAHRWTLTPRLKVSRIISVIGTYEGRSERTFSGDRVVDHEFKLETRAFF